MLIESKYKPDKKHYEYNHVFYLGDDFGNKGRLCFDINPDTIKRYQIKSMMHPSAPKIDVPIERMSISLEESKDILKFCKTAKIIKQPTIKQQTFAFNLPIFLNALSNTDIDFLYESKEHLDQVAIIEQHKPMLFKPKPKK